MLQVQGLGKALKKRREGKEAERRERKAKQDKKAAPTPKKGKPPSEASTSPRKAQPPSPSQVLLRQPSEPVAAAAAGVLGAAVAGAEVAREGSGSPPAVGRQAVFSDQVGPSGGGSAAAALLLAADGGGASASGTQPSPGGGYPPLSCTDVAGSSSATADGGSPLPTAGGGVDAAMLPVSLSAAPSKGAKGEEGEEEEGGDEDTQFRVTAPPSVSLRSVKSTHSSNSDSR